MQNMISGFLEKTKWRKFATVDFEHYLNRYGIAMPRLEVEQMLLYSTEVVPTPDGM